MGTFYRRQRCRATNTRLSHMTPPAVCSSCRTETAIKKDKNVNMKECAPQLCLWSSSLMSPQSLSPSQIQVEAMHLPSSHRNCSVLQVRTCWAAETSCDIRQTKQNTHLKSHPQKQRIHCIFKMNEHVFCARFVHLFKKTPTACISQI